MSGPLDDWQERLSRHFNGLVEKRAASGFPIFALEHDLTSQELKELGGLLHAYLRGNQRLSAYWLLWVIYATEQGYGYDGHEYWISFEQNTPHWHGRGRAEALRSYFERFQRTHNGVIPSGPWASCFRNIAWPITHAILPRYLQYQFASALYDARYQLARMHSPTPAVAGKLLANNAWHATSRFREFLEQEELAGRLALVLLDYGTTQGRSPIYEPTLKRIVDDLSRIRRAGEWLKETRRFVADRFHGVDRSSGVHIREDASIRPISPQELPNVRPALLLRRSTESTWTVIADVPSFGALARQSPELGRFLKSTRCTLAGTGGAMLPAGWTLYGSQKRVLKSWPQRGTLMISFEKSNSLLENILGHECRFDRGPIWLFRIASDGLAYEVTSRTVRAGQRYIVLSREPLSHNLTFAVTANIQCDGVVALSLNMPRDGIETDDTAELRKLGIEVSRNIRLWPAGLCIRNWDGEGHGDWLTTEKPCFGIVHDYAVDEYFIRLDGGSELMVDGARAGEPIFVRLQSLPPGRHSLSVRAKRIGLPAGSRALKDLEGRIEIRVRDPAPWKPGTTAYSGLAVTIDPPEPTLDTFWEGGVRVSVLGPEGHDVTCSVSLTGRNGSDLLSENIGKFGLPITYSNWSKQFKRFANDDARAWKYLDASKGRFVIKGEELGEFTLLLERDAKPVRWLCRNTQQAVQARLVDDTGRDTVPGVRFFSFRQPGKAQSLDIAEATNGIQVSEPGGLFFAYQDELGDILVISSTKRAMLTELIITPDTGSLGSDLKELIALIDLWHRARVAGPLAENRRDNVVRCLITRLYAVLCGSRWASAETSFFANPRSEHYTQLEQAIETHGFPAVLRHNRALISQGTSAGARWFADAAQRYNVCTDARLAKFALRVASKPFDLSRGYGEEVPALLDSVAKIPILMRSARYVALLSIADDPESPIYCLPRWTW